MEFSLPLLIQNQMSVLVSPRTEDEKQQNSAFSCTQSYFLGDTSGHLVGVVAVQILFP